MGLQSIDGAIEHFGRAMIDANRRRQASEARPRPSQKSPSAGVRWRARTDVPADGAVLAMIHHPNRLQVTSHIGESLSPI